MQHIPVDVAEIANSCRVLHSHNEDIVCSFILGSKCKNVIAFIVRYSSDPELQSLLSFITYARESDLLPPFY